MASDEIKDPAWWVFRTTDTPHDGIERLPKAPPWRTFASRAESDDGTDASESDTRAFETRGEGYQLGEVQRDVVNAALYLRRPMLVRGKPGVGKTTLAYAIARQLKLPRVLRWSITSHTTLKDGLYSYDAIGRLQESSLQGGDASDNGNKLAAPIEDFLKLGPVGTALADSRLGRPRVLLIDELDKSDIDLPNDLLHIFEEGEFPIPELERMKDASIVKLKAYGADPDEPCIAIRSGMVRCSEFPIVVMTSNDERDFPPAFRRRCIEVDIPYPDEQALAAIVATHLKDDEDYQRDPRRVDEIIERFLEARGSTDHGHLATDQLLQAIQLAMRNVDINERLQRIGDDGKSSDDLISRLWKPL